MTIQEYADREGISYQAARKAFLRHGSQLIEDRHVKEQGRTTLIDDYAADYLASKRRKKKVTSLMKTVQDDAKNDGVPETALQEEVYSRTIDEIIAFYEKEIEKYHETIAEDSYQLSNIARRIRSNNHKIEVYQETLNGLYKEKIKELGGK